MTKVEVLDLVTVGRSLPADTDHAITGNLKGKVLLIRLEPGRAYPTEIHQHATETILALSGRFVIEADGHSYAVSQGQCCRIPPGLEHRWGSDSDAVVQVHFGTPCRDEAYGST